MTVIEWLVGVDKSLLPIYAAAIITIGLYGYLKPEKEEKKEPPYIEPQKINTEYDGDIPPSTLSLRETYFIPYYTPTINDMIQNSPPVEGGTFVGQWRGRNVYKVYDINDAYIAHDNDYVIYEDKIYQREGKELVTVAI